MQEILISELRPHPQNNYFFDDMTGEKWKEFLASIKSRGVIEPIIATEDMIVVSGHQRLRACKELGIDKVKVEIRHYNNDDEILQELIETNVQQRGTIDGSTIKLGRRIKELERLYGIERGGDRKSEKIKPTNGGFDPDNPKTQEELAKQLGIDNMETLRRAKKLASLPLEIQDLVSDGKISASTASRLIAKLSPEEQEQLAAALPATEKLTQKQVQEYIGLLQEKDDEIQRLASRPTEIKYPDDYDDLRKYRKTMDADYRNLEQEYRKQNNELLKIKEEQRQSVASTPEKQIEEQLKEDVMFFCSRCDTFIKSTGGLAYLANKIDSLPDNDKRNYKIAINRVMESVEPIVAWAQNILSCIS